MKSCPNCGSTAGFSVNVRLAGYNVHHGKWDSDEEKLVDTTHVVAIRANRVRCVDCGKRVKYPDRKRH